MKFPQITASQVKVYIGVVGAVGLGVYQLTQGQIETGLATISAAVALLGINGTTSATRAFIDPRVPTPAVDHRIEPEALQGLHPREPVMVIKGTSPDAYSAMGADQLEVNPRFHANVFHDQATGQTAYQVESRNDAGDVNYAVFFHGKDGEKAFREYLARNGEDAPVTS